MHESDSGTRGQGGRTIWIGLLALLFLAGGLGAWYLNTGDRQARGDDDAIERALALADPDSVAIKTKWVETVPDTDVSDLGPERQETFVRLVNARYCDCGCGYTLGACRNFDPTCEFSGPIVETLLDSLRAGHTMRLEGLRPRPDAR